MRARGSSLLEMLLVLALVAGMGTLAAFMVTGGLEGVRLRGSAKEIVAQLRFARTQAIATAQPQRFVLDMDGHRWEGANGKQGRIPENVTLRFTGTRQAQSRADEGAIVFFPDGGSTGGRIELIRNEGVWRIDVAWLTGSVRLARVEPRP